MALKLKNPTHAADRGGLFISSDDDAWDQDLIRADMDVVEVKARTEFQDAVEAKYRETRKRAGHEVTDEEIVALREHTVLSKAQREAAWAPLAFSRYQRGETRFDIDCDDWDPEGKPMTLRSRYLTKGKPTTFAIRRLSYRDYNNAEEIGNSNERLLEFCRLGLKGIDSPDLKWRADDSKKRVPEEIMQDLHDADESLPLAIGTAVILLCRKLSRTERFR